MEAAVQTPEEGGKGSSSKHLQNVYDKKAAMLQAKMPWYKNSSQNVDIPGVTSAFPDIPADTSPSPSLDFLQGGKTSQHTATVSLFPEHDEPRLQAALTKASRQSATPSHSPSKSHQTPSPDRKRGGEEHVEIKWRGRVSWESDLLEPTGPKTPSKRASPLKNVLPSMLPASSADEARSGASSNPPSPSKRSSAVSSAEKEDEIDALLSKFKICADARAGIRDNLLSKYTPQAPHSYVFTSPDATFIDADADDVTRLMSPSVPERRMRDVKTALAHDGGENSSSDDEPDEDADVAQQMKESYFGLAARGKFFAKYAGLHAKPHCFMAVPHQPPLHLPSPQRAHHHDTSLPSVHSPPKGQDPSAANDGRSAAHPGKDDSTPPRMSHYDYLPAVPAKPPSPRQSTQPPRVANANEVKMSPRTMFLSACLSNTGNLPIALPILIRKHGTTAFDFSYQSLGDAFLTEFAKALRDVPFVESINVCDNRLTDRALNQLLQALETKPNLTKLDISMNQVGARSAKTLKAYIGSPMCTLTHLGVCMADIDDSECAAFMVAFEANKSVVQLRMSRNRIGEAENLNVVQPDFVTGGEAIGGMLNVNLTLTQLDVSWNLLRLASGVTLANSLKLNYNLFELNLAYNALGDAGAMAFGQSLCINKTLRLLDMSYNNVGTKGASVLASTVSRSRTISSLVLDGNNIGQPGGKVLMYAMVHNRTPNGCTVSMKGCNLNERTQAKVFDPMEPAGDYVLDCADPYDNMVATELLRLATVKKGCSFAKLEAKPTRDAPKKLTQTIKLVRQEQPPSRPARARGVNKTLLDLSFHDMDTKSAGCITLSELHGVLLELGFQPALDQTETLFNKIDTDGSGTIDEAELSGGGLFHAVFRTIDANASGTIDMDELRQAFVVLGAKATEEDVQAAMNTYDVDGSGTIEEDEFVELMKHQVIQKLNQHHAAHSVESLALRDESSGAVWTVPSTGFLDITFVYERELMNDRESFMCYGLSENGLKKLVQSVERGKETMQQAELLNVAVHETEIRMTAAQAIVLMESCGDMHETKRVGAVAKVLPQLTSIKEAQTLVKRVLTTSERFSLRLRLGALYFPLLGLPTNHYNLDLARPQDRQALAKLAEIAQAEKQFSKSRSGRGDTSQHGNWENFRNEWLDGKPTILTSHFFQTMPQKGKLEFDYVSTTRPTRGTKPMSDRRYQQLLAQIARDSRTELRLDAIPTRRRRHSVKDRWDLVRNAVRYRKFKKWIRNVQMAFHVHSHTKEDIGYKLFQIEAAVCDRWLSVDQAAEIVRCMPSAHGGKTDTCRLLFPRVIDIENFMEIFDALSFPEKNECARVLGWLNILNPLHPDRYYEFDLSSREEREAAKIFVKLAVSEPGENWINESFGWVRGEPPIPGWELPKSWANDDVTAEDGPRRTGWLTFEYTSDPARGCAAVPSVRQELTQRVLCGTRLYL
ncbi:hypothetical protein, variant [Aphanomyces invadans]|uniref:EF-hand domain-containing protein n=1 Tax=Aphanomyces invadans TaxID=157072 RepID=A0A024TS14_9STRA|nr:hypothetical protein, variant [Aphanomyces invadans]ETV96818.1 hypothetical protein, variant [Aphanomyces invadans]|eukprot:XP_008874594.1 hypothetical protein, variant [Aphanomyces invadans]